MTDDLAASAFEKIDYLLDVVVIFFLRDSSYAASLAFADMKVQARTKLPSQDGI